MKTNKIMFEPNQIYPYRADHPRAAGLMKYGAVKVPSQFPRKLSAVASPKACARIFVLANSPPRSHAYGAAVRHEYRH